MFSDGRVMMVRGSAVTIIGHPYAVIVLANRVPVNDNEKRE